MGGGGWGLILNYYVRQAAGGVRCRRSKARHGQVGFLLVRFPPLLILLLLYSLLIPT